MPETRDPITPQQLSPNGSMGKGGGKIGLLAAGS